jgi:hypothetical protein
MQFHGTFKGQPTAGLLATQAHFNRKLYWCRGRFTDYKVFSSSVKIAAS